METNNRPSIPALERLHAEATPGPWNRGPGSHDVRMAGGCRAGITIQCRTGLGDHSRDADLIAAARNALPALLALARAAKRLDDTFYFGDGPEAVALRVTLAALDFGEEGQ